MKSQDLLPLVAVSVGFFSCSKEITGPAPTFDAILPVAVCQAQITTTVSMSGSGFAPLHTQALEESQLELPRVTLTPGGAIPGFDQAFVDLPDDSEMAMGNVRWQSATQMSFDITPDMNLPPGLYGIEVENPNGEFTQLPNALLSVPPPAITALSTNTVCGDKQSVFTIAGDFLIRHTDSTTLIQSLPVAVFIDTVSGSPIEVPQTQVSDCRPLPGAGGFEACRSLAITPPPGVLPRGNYHVVLRNPAPVACDSTTDPSGTVKTQPIMTVVSGPTVVDVQPDVGCVAGNSVPITITGAGFLTIGTATPTVMVGDATEVPAMVANCVPVPGTDGASQVCTTITATVPTSQASGNYLIRVKNPAPADCVSPEDVPLILFDRPAVATVEPDSVCSDAGNTMINIVGTNFVTYGIDNPTVQIGDQMVPATPDGCTPVEGPGRATQTCTTVTANLFPSPSMVGDQAVVVTNPAPLSCPSMSMASLRITDPPTLNTVTPPDVDPNTAVLTLEGTDFRADAIVTLDGVEAMTVVVNPEGTLAIARFGPGLTPGGPYDVTITNGPMCGDTRARAVSVLDGMQ